MIHHIVLSDVLGASQIIKSVEDLNENDKCSGMEEPSCNQVLLWIILVVGVYGL